MDLYLIRHADAGERDPARWPDDSQRPLTKKGSRRFGQAAKGLVSIVDDVDIVLASPYRRTWETAVVLEGAGWPEPQRLDELAGGEPGALLRALRRFDGLDSIALVGHEPYLSRFAAALLGAAPWGEMRKGGVARLRQERISISAGASTLDWYLTPRLLRKLR